MTAPLRLGVIGHVEHVTLGRIATAPRSGEIAHLLEPRMLAGGGGGISLFQLARSAAEVHFFTALGNDEAGHAVEHAITTATRVIMHAARRAEPHTRDIVMIEPSGERTIVVIGEPLHPVAADPLPWELLDTLDAVYFTAQDPAALVLARRARVLVVTARRRACIEAAGVPIDVIVGSRFDPVEASERTDFLIPPSALVMTEGARGGSVASASGVVRFQSPHVQAVRGTYGAGDSFAGALTYYLAAGETPERAAARAAPHGAAVLSSMDPVMTQLGLPHDPRT